MVHVEVQGYTDKYFAERMFTYFYRILDKYKKPITAFAIFTDDNKNFRPSVYEQNFLGTSLRYEFNTYKIIDQSEQELAESNNPFAQVVLTVMTAIKAKGLQDEQIFDIKLELTKRLLVKTIPKRKIRIMMNFLRFYIHFENPEMNSKFENTLKEITQNNTTMGIEEFLLERAEKKGIEKERIEFIKSLLVETDFSNEKIARLVGTSIELVEKIKKNQ